MHTHDDLAALDAVRARKPAASDDRPGDVHARLLALQRSIGNSGVSALVQRRGEQEDEHPDPLAGVIGAGNGRPLEEPVRAEMEQVLGADLSGVRIHTGPAAAASARSLQAKAYTVGDDVVFGDGGFDPTSTDGRTTLAHELTHVVQQRSGPVDGTDTGLGFSISDPADRFEQQADAVGRAVGSGAVTAGTATPGASSAQLLAADAGVQRELEPEEDEELQTMVQREMGPEEEEQEEELP